MTDTTVTEQSVAPRNKGGRPLGAMTKTKRELIELVRSGKINGQNPTELALLKVVELMQHREPMVALAASKFTLEFAYGKTVMVHVHDENAYQRGLQDGRYQTSEEAREALRARGLLIDQVINVPVPVKKK